MGLASPGLSSTNHQSREMKLDDGGGEVTGSEDIRFDVQRTGDSFLIVDDIVYLLNAMAMEFEQHSIPTVKVTNSANALQHLKQGHFRCVLCDHRLPNGASGTEMVTAFREWERAHRPATPQQIIFGITGHVDDAVLAACREAGMDEVFQKPIEVGEVLRALGALESR